MVAVCFLRSTLYYYAEPRSAIYPGNIESVFACVKGGYPFQVFLKTMQYITR